MLNRLPFYDTTLSQELLGCDPIGVRVPCRGDWPVACFVPRAKIKDARAILAKQASGEMSDGDALDAINRLGRAS